MKETVLCDVLQEKKGQKCWRYIERFDEQHNDRRIIKTSPSSMMQRRNFTEGTELGNVAIRFVRCVVDKSNVMPFSSGITDVLRTLGYNCRLASSYPPPSTGTLFKINWQPRRGLPFAATRFKGYSAGNRNGLIPLAEKPLSSIQSSSNSVARSSATASACGSFS